MTFSRMMASVIDTSDVDHAGTGAARRRREWRLRAYLRYARMSVAMALAEANHHSAPRRPKTARAETTDDALRSQRNSVAGETELFSLYEDDLGAARPDRLAGVRPQERITRRTVEQIVDSSPGLSIIDVPVPQMVDQLVDVLNIIERSVPAVAEQVIEVPKILLQDQIPQRTVLCEPQLAEQLEVPTVVSQSFFQQQFAEQNVDISVPGARGLLDGGGLRGFLPEQSPTGRRWLDGGGLQFFPQGQGSSALRFVAYPPAKKSARVATHSSAEVGAHSSSSELRAHQMAPGARSGSSTPRPQDDFVEDVDGNVWMRWDAGQWKLLGTAPLDASTTWVDGNDEPWTLVNMAHGSYWLILDTRHTQWHPPWEH